MSIITKTNDVRTPPISRAYWICQLVGWSALFLFELGFVALAAAMVNERLPMSIARYGAEKALVDFSGLTVSHLVYLQMRRRRWLQMPLKSAWPRLVAAIAVAAAVMTGINMLARIFIVRSESLRQVLRPGLVLLVWIGAAFTLAFWMLLYLTIHEFRKRRAAEVRALRMELVAQEAQMRGLRAQLNPHFLFNCLNSLRELIVEDPRRAQTMVTQLSKLLRYSLQSDQKEQVLLEDEVQAVKDYLALEAIRFEERLRIQWNIAPGAYGVRVPPMLLQTLVENALKHGISRRPEGGEISIQAMVRDSRLELEVMNSGELLDQPSEEGIGLRNARTRLQLLYGDQARIVLENDNANGAHGQVRALATIPMKGTGAPQ